MPNMVHAVWRGSLTILVALNNREHPLSAEWDAYCDSARDRFADPAGLAGQRALSISDGGGPTARQRAQVVEVARGLALRWALVSSSRFARGIATALSWAIGGFRAFAPHEMRRALRYLELPPDEEPDFLRWLQELDGPMRLSAIAELEQPDLQLE